jgi:CO/xanthine dehydrogenase Mo-binding subunit
VPVRDAFADHSSGTVSGKTESDVSVVADNHQSSRSISRRGFGAAAAGLLFFFTLKPRHALAQSANSQIPVDLQTNKRLDAWLRIDPKGGVEVFTGKVELGQGNLTALAQMTAEELEVDIKRVRMLPVDTAGSPNESYTAGSASIDAGGAALRYAAANARAVLLEMAAVKLGVAVDSLRIDDGTVIGPPGQRVTYWDLASAGPLARDVRDNVSVKAPTAFRLIGNAVPRLDIPAKVTGGEAFIQDMRLTGMLFGRVVRPPTYNAELTACDETAVSHMPGVVKVVRDGRFLGLVAQREEQAITARAALQRAAVWSTPADLPDEARMTEYLRGAPDAKVTTVSSRSAPPDAPPAVKTASAAYSKPYIAHASIGPSCALAMTQDGILTVWSHTQGPFPLRSTLATAMGLPAEKVRVIHAQGSGCYGHNGADDAALDAALLSRAVDGAPVKVQWMRDDEFAWEPFGSAMSLGLQAGLAADGSIVDWQFDLWSNSYLMRPGIPGGVNLLAAWHLAKPFKPSPPIEIPLPAGGTDRNAVPYYEFASQRIIEHFLPTMPLRVSSLRSLGAFGNVFAIESFMDELAAIAGADVVDYRLRHLKDERAKVVIRTAAQRASWQSGEKGDGTRGRGVAFVRYETNKAYVALIADILVDRATNNIRVERITAAVDAGLIVNPDGLNNQIEGAIIQGISWTLKEALRFDRQRITSRNWASYPILTFPEVPELDIVLINHPELPTLGVAEAALPPVPAAIANAFFNATGNRLRDLPFDRDRVKAALS